MPTQLWNLQVCAYIIAWYCTSTSFMCLSDVVNMEGSSVAVQTCSTNRTDSTN
jgi:hypothetical protein